MPLLTRMLASPVCVDVRRGALAGLPDVLIRQRISSEGAVLVAVGQGQGRQVEQALAPLMPNASFRETAGSDMDSAADLAAALGRNGFDALVGVGGGRTLDIAKYAASRTATPMVAVATNLAHDGICSPVSSLDHLGGKGSFGVAMPIAVLVDLDMVASAPPEQVRSGIGDVVSNLSAIEDWQLSAEVTGEAVDGLAVAFARTAAEAVLHRTDGITEDPFLVTLAEALLLSGMAMGVAGTSRPCSGACHEIVHAVQQLYPGVSNHGELAGVGALFASHLRGDPRSAAIAACLRRHGLPVTPSGLGLTEPEFVRAVLLAPETRPTRYTILEHLHLGKQATQARVHEFEAAYSRPRGKRGLRSV